MKKILSMMAVAMMFSFYACGPKAEEQAATEEVAAPAEEVVAPAEEVAAEETPAEEAPAAEQK
jgi:predicted small lipoprotein YifL